MAPSVSAYVPASSRRRPLIPRRAHSSHGATRVSLRSAIFSVISPLFIFAVGAPAQGLRRSTGGRSTRQPSFHRNVDAEVGADLIAEHAADAVVLVGDDHRE